MACLCDHSGVSTENGRVATIMAKAPELWHDNAISSPESVITVQTPANEQFASDDDL